MRTSHVSRSKFAVLTTIVASLLLVMLLSACDGGTTTTSSNPNASPTANDFPTGSIATPTHPIMVEPAKVTPTTVEPTMGQILMPQPNPVTSFKVGDTFWVQNGTTSTGPESLNLTFKKVTQDSRCGHLTTDPVAVGMVMECAVNDAAIVQIAVNQQTFNLALYNVNQGGSDQTVLGSNSIQVNNYFIELLDLLYEPCKASRLSDCPTFAQFVVKPVEVATLVQLGSQFGLSLHQKVNGPNGLTMELIAIDSGAKSPTMDIKLSQNGQTQTTTVTMFGANSPNPATVSWHNYQLAVKKIYPVALNSDPNDYLALLILTQP